MRDTGRRRRASVRSRPRTYIESNSGSPARRASTASVEERHDLAGLLMPMRLDRRTDVAGLDRPLAGLEVGDHRVEHLGRALGLGDDLLPLLRDRSPTRRRRRTGTPPARRGPRSWSPAPGPCAPPRAPWRRRPRRRTSPGAARRSPRRGRRAGAPGCTRRSASRASCSRRTRRSASRGRDRTRATSSSRRHHLAAVGRRPAQQGEVVRQRRRGGSRGRGSPRARPRRDASTASPGPRRRAAGGARSAAGRLRRARRAARGRGAWSRSGPRPG